jgi:hypothetical protein
VAQTSADRFREDPLKFVLKSLKLREDQPRDLQFRKTAEFLQSSGIDIDRLAFQGSGRKKFGKSGGQFGQTSGPDVPVDFFRGGPGIQDPGKSISPEELSGEAGRLLVLDRIAEQAMAIARRENQLGHKLDRIDKFLLFRSASGVSKADLVGLNKTEQINLIEKGLRVTDELVVGLASAKLASPRGEFLFGESEQVKGLKERAAESLASFTLNIEGDLEAESLLRRLERGQLGHRASIRTSPAGIPRRRSGRSISAARTSQLGQQIGPRDAPKGNLFTGPSGLLENNILGTRGELGT